MRMSFSSLWRKGFRRSAEEPEQPTTRGGKTTIAWVGESGEAHCRKTSLRERFEGGVSIDLDMEIPADRPIWLVSSDGFGRAGILRDCIPKKEKFVGRVAFIPDQGPGKNGSERPTARVRWMEGSSHVVATPVSVKNSRHGEIEVELGEALPVPTIVLLQGVEFQCVGSVTRCLGEHGRWLATVEVLSGPYPIHFG